MTTLTFKTEGQQVFLGKQKVKECITLLICLMRSQKKSIGGPNLAEQCSMKTEYYTECSNTLWW